MEDYISLPTDSEGEMNFSPVGVKWMRDERTPEDVCGEARIT